MKSEIIVTPAALAAAAHEISAVDYPNYDPDLELARTVLEAAAPHLLAESEAAIAAVLQHCEAREKIAADNGGLIAIAYTSDIRAIIEGATRRVAADAWDEAHFDALGCDGSCCDLMHAAPRKSMNPYRSAE